MTYQESIAWLEGVSLYSQKDGLDNMRRLMERFGDPQESIPAVHVAGTNGKGTTCAFLESMLRTSGKKTGLFTSPHLVRYTERIRVNNQEISEEDFARTAGRVREQAEALQAEGVPHPTFFQLLTAMAFLYFAEQQVDVMVVEVGLGGRLDATNILSKPLVSVITSISYDHVKVLGSTLPAIAGEKAGIIKPGCPVVVGHNKPEVMAVFEEKARETGSPLYEADTVPSQVLQNDEDGISLQQGNMIYRTSLCGDYQVDNLKTALAAAVRIGIPFRDMQQGIRKTQWTGRMQWIAGRPRMLLEGAHNEEGAERLGIWSREHLAGKDATILFSALRKKDVTSILKALLSDTPFVRIVFAKMQDDSGLTGEEFTEIAKDYLGGRPVFCTESVAEGLKTARENTSPDGLICCCGSLYLVGEVLAELEKAGKAEAARRAERRRPGNRLRKGIRRGHV